MSTLRIDERYAGPPGTANGGIASGLLAGTLADPVVEVTLRRPPPLGTDLRIEAGSLYDGDLLLATAVPGRVGVDPPGGVSVAVAAATASSYGGLVDHPFPGCFVCGTGRTDGLGLRPGNVAAGHVAAVWTPADEDPVMVWAALDCPGGWSADLPGRPLVLGRMALRLDALPAVGEPVVVQGWTVGTQGRKVLTGSSLRTADGRLLALAQATWLAIPPSADAASP